MRGSIRFWILVESGIYNFFGACSSAWLERTPDKREVDGSNPSRPTIKYEGRIRTIGFWIYSGV